MKAMMAASTRQEPMINLGDEATADGSLAMIKGSAEISISVGSLRPAFYWRQSGMDAAHIRLLAEAASVTKLPPILVQKSSSRIIDGMHRAEVARLRGEQSIRALLVDCSDDEALILAIRSNTLHGLPLSKADRIASAKLILTQHSDWSNRAVAEITGMSPNTVASLRDSSAAPEPLDPKRLGRDGKRHPAVAGEGRRRAAEYLNAHPEASVREIARAALVSVGTAQDVRGKIRDESSHPVEQPARPAGRRSCDPVAGAGPLIAKLTKDPAMRYAEAGRAFLRWMTAHSAHPEEWREFADAIPQRWLPDVHRVAISMSDEWRRFADQLGYMMEAAARRSLESGQAGGAGSM